MSKFEEFLQEINTLPIEIRKSLVLMRQLDVKKDELQNTNNRIAKQYFQSLDKKKLKKTSESHQQADKVKIIDQIRANYDQIQRWSQEKLSLARKVYTYIEANLGKINNKMLQMEENMSEENLEAYGLKRDKFEQRGSKQSNKKQKQKDLPFNAKSKKIQKTKNQQQQMSSKKVGKLGWQFSSDEDEQDMKSKYIFRDEDLHDDDEESKYSEVADDYQHEEDDYDADEIIKTNYSKGKHNTKKKFTEDDIDTMIEAVSYEQNQELLRAFGGQNVGQQPHHPHHPQFHAQSTKNIGHSISSNQHQSQQQQQQQQLREPTYCFCNNVSYGDMIACDNKVCPYEWFHFPCVGLTSKPEGKWFCQKCLLGQQSMQELKKAGNNNYENNQAVVKIQEQGSQSRSNGGNRQAARNNNAQIRTSSGERVTPGKISTKKDKGSAKLRR